ncbi:DnaJ like chaperone protein [Litoreibacter halocynthiae]|uniref:DnaJ like chaperone protein n=1 Tax=Litoreibacter halocynthiae TaxID=1242689 RepID=A0A4R7LSE8_9RHOB|nr:molecular chaperone DjiA [Litoreibacter halocynthiae]TDT77170.1 DnaJ like chaperone protein [Litoreibacter halocynthiae]
MSVWTRISNALSALAAGESLSDVFAHLRTPPERRVGFTIAVIALGAKMAKADGRVTRDEVAAFREVFTIAPEDEAQAAKLFNLARQDVAGFDDYARKIATMFEDNHSTLYDLMEGLFHIAVADGSYHPLEDEFLLSVAAIFKITEPEFRCLRARFVADATPDPYAVLEATPEMALEDVRKRWRQLVKDTHPDVMAARGVPHEAVKMAEKRLIRINAAWAEILAEREPVA